MAVQGRTDALQLRRARRATARRRGPACSNPLAQKHLRAVKKGDRIFFYHTGDEKAVVGVMKAAANAAPDPADEDRQAVRRRRRRR